ncbi:MAG: HAD family phosphatase [Microbacterium sp.]
MIDEEQRGRLRGVLWDMDGTSINSASVWNAAIRTAATEVGIAWNDSDDAAVRGHGMWSVAARFQMKNADLSDAERTVAQIERFTVDLAATARPVWLPGVQEMLTACADEGVRCALVTMSGRESVEAILGALDLDLFEVIISGSDVVKPKPAPEPYLRGLDALGLTADSCVALEDSFVGITSAVSAGLTTIAVNAPSSVHISGPVTRWDTLAGRTLGDLREVHAAVGARL